MLRRPLWRGVLLGLVALTPALALAQPSRQEQLQEEARDYYKQWLDQDVLYIITEEEREVFLKLQTPDERDRFIEQFWLRRDPNPRSGDNEFKIEHYRRLQFANENFTSGQPGWKSDRGRIYIKFGPPDRRDTNPTGGYYERPSYEGGGSTQALPFEKWEYRHIEGVGEDIEIEFVDDTLTGEYRMTTNPDDKDVLLRIPGAGLTEAEAQGRSFRSDRILRRTNPMPGNNPLLVGYGRLKDQPFEKLKTFTDLQKPPAISFRDFFKPQITVEVGYQLLPFQMRVDFVQASSQEYLVPVTVEVDSNSLDFVKDERGELSAVLEVFGGITTLGGGLVETFEETIGTRLDDTTPSGGSEQQLIYQKTLRLKPGRYKLDLVLRDHQSLKFGHVSRGVVLPAGSPDALSISSILLADRIEAGADPEGAGPFGTAKIFPNVKGSFSGDQPLLVFYQLSQYAVEVTSQQPSLVCRIVLQRGGAQVYAEDFRIGDTQTQHRDRLRLVHQLGLEGMEPGEYTLILTVRDEISGQHLTRKAPFRIRTSDSRDTTSR